VSDAAGETELDRHGGTGGEPEPERLRFRVILVACLFGWFGTFWVIQNSLLRAGVQVGGSVPPIPALAALGLLALLNPRLRRWGLTRSESVLVYLFVAVCAGISHVDVLGYFFAYLTVPQYFGAKEGFAPFVERLPEQFAPKDPNVIRTFFEGSWSFGVPWQAWLPALLGWSLFLWVLWATLHAILSLFRERWIAHERLRFPIVDFSLTLLGDGPSGARPFRDPLLWAGIGLSTLYNLLNILHALYPNVPASGRYLDVAPFFPDPPWSSLRPMFLSFRPEILGLGYLVNTDVLFTVWATYLVFRLCGVGLRASGYEILTGYYDYQEIAAGAYLGVLAVLIWQGRVHLARVWRSNRPGEPGARTFLLVLVGFGYLVWWTAQCGLNGWLAALYLFLILAFAVVYARMRAEAGAPLIFLFPFWQQQKLLVNFLGTPTLAATGASSLVMLAALGFLARGVYPELASYQLDGMELGERARIPARWVTAFLLAAVPFGLAIGYWFYLTNAYRYGFGLLDGGTGQGGGRVTTTVQQYRMLLQWQGHYLPPNLSLIGQTAAGFLAAIGIVWLRGAFLSCPLHPLGFAMATSYGFHLWFPFCCVWALKLLILRLGGAAGYRRLVPLFLGIVLGHYLVAGVIWGALSLINPEAARAYVVHFS